MRLPVPGPDSFPRKQVRKVLKSLLRENAVELPPFAGHYDEWRRRRLAAIVTRYGPAWFAGKTVLELGAGYGDLGARLAIHYGANVTCVEGREENVEEIKRRYPHVRAIAADLDGDWQADREYDLVLHLGVLYHLSKPAESIARSAAAGARLVLETEVCDSLEPDRVIYVSEDAAHFDQALTGKGCRPSPAFVERALTAAGMRYERVENGLIDTFHDQNNGPNHVYTWPIGNTGRYESGWRKFWFAER